MINPLRCRVGRELGAGRVSNKRIENTFSTGKSTIVRGKCVRLTCTTCSVQRSCFRSSSKCPPPPPQPLQPPRNVRYTAAPVRAASGVADARLQYDEHIRRQRRRQLFVNGACYWRAPAFRLAADNGWARGRWVSAVAGKRGEPGRRGGELYTRDSVRVFPPPQPSYHHDENVQCAHVRGRGKINNKTCNAHHIYLRSSSFTYATFLFLSSI